MTRKTRRLSEGEMTFRLHLSVECHQKIKIWCKQRKISMQGALEKMISDAFSNIDIQDDNVVSQ